MLDAITISHVFVFDQDEALDFYVGKLGLEVEEDLDLGFMRWLTVCVPGDRSRRILLEKAAPPSLDEESAAQIRELVSKGATGFTVGFTTPDCRATFEELKAKGVEIREEPVDRFYGVDMGIRDPFGNAIRIVEPKERTA